jgi:hypothetical protein
MVMTQIKKTFGTITPQQFINEVDTFIDLSHSIKNIECLNQGVKTLSIMYISLSCIDSNQQDQCDLYYKKAIQIQIDIEKTFNALNFNIDDLSIRAELAKESAFSHENY